MNFVEQVRIEPVDAQNNQLLRSGRSRPRVLAGTSKSGSQHGGDAHQQEHTRKRHFLKGAVTEIWSANTGPASWLATMGGDHGIATRGDPEEQVQRLYKEFAGTSRLGGQVMGTSL